MILLAASMHAMKKKKHRMAGKPSHRDNFKLALSTEKATSLPLAADGWESGTEKAGSTACSVQTDEWVASCAA